MQTAQVARAERELDIRERALSHPLGERPSNPIPLRAPPRSHAQEPHLLRRKASTLYLCRQLAVREFSQVGGATASQQQREDHTKNTRPRPPELRVEHRDCVEHAQLGERTSQPGERCA